MQGLRIRGLTRIANRIRRELAQPVSVNQKSELARLAMDSVRQVDRIVADHRTRIQALPAPTRLAYEFLASLDVDRIATAASADPTGRPRESVAPAGLVSNWERLIAGMAAPGARLDGDHPYASLVRLSRAVEEFIETRRIQVDELTPRTRQIRGWLAFFAVRENFDAYLEALGRTRSIFEVSFRSHGIFRTPAFVQFRPVRSLYQIRAVRDGTRVVLPTPMISFAPESIELLAGMATRSVRARRLVLEAIASDEYQAIQAELETLGGISDRSGGVYRNLDASFERVNSAYFGNAIGRPRLTWSTGFTRRKFGHYEHTRDTVMVSATLDHSAVPEYVLDSVMHHELLHKQLGVDWRNDRMSVHSPEFRRLEQQFRRYAEAETFLKRLASQRR